MNDFELKLIKRLEDDEVGGVVVSYSKYLDSYAWLKVSGRIDPCTERELLQTGRFCHYKSKPIYHSKLINNDDIAPLRVVDVNAIDHYNANPFYIILDRLDSIGFADGVKVRKSIIEQHLTSIKGAMKNCEERVQVHLSKIEEVLEGIH